MRVVRSMVARFGHALPVVAVGLLVFWLIRIHVLEWYIVPSTSMEPTLRGDPDDGDLVLVDKTAFWFGRPQRFDMVVVRSQSERGPGQVVKRLIASGDDDLPVVSIEAGDVFLGATRQTLERVRKHPADARDLRLTHFVWPGRADVGVADYLALELAAAELLDQPPRLELRGAAPDLTALAATLTSGPGTIPTGHLSTRSPIDTSFLDEDGHRWGKAEFQRDVGIEIDVTLGAESAGFHIVLEYQGTFSVMTFTARGTAHLIAQGQHIVPEFSPRTRISGGRHTIAFGYLDGRFFVEIDGVVELVREHDLNVTAPPDRVPDNRIHVGAAGSVTIERIRVFHDVYYQTLRAPFEPLRSEVFELQPGELFLLGDNTFDSRDSRSGKRFLDADLVGRPLAIIGPARRRRWLTR